ncbi:tripartite tricarboxylate transporter substrate binding protein [Verticiella sediminum]|uniref:Tripartite tricarboxylate transporter substrate binding protein n=1 Tax=Verticiella sediminum TaxID=1247510 RepID=A0A556AWK7_9BURK|nr:tripartite tricarboxylate transporter substrate binding protein [Verticiella sediminum]TSH97332.1 tripartite tricarboxylate transporter substrate binding protein [Verticiella sediminum]
MIARTVIAAAAFAGIASTGAAFAQSADGWPARPITLIVPSTAGGSTDIVARILSEGLRKQLGQAVIVENKSGAAGTIGLQTALRAPSDGYTYVFGYPSNLIVTQFTMPDISFVAVDEFVPIGGIAINEMVMNASAAVHATNPKELVEWARTQSTEPMYGSYGQGSYSHIVAAYLGTANQFKATHIPYKAERELLTALATNDVAYGVSVVTAGKALQDTGKTRMVGLLAPRRSTQYPDIPTFKEMGIDDPAFSLLGWNGLFAKKDTPPAILRRMEQAVQQVMSQPETQQRMIAASSTPWGASAQALDKTWKSEIPIYEALTQAANLSE